MQYRPSNHNALNKTKQRYRSTQRYRSISFQCCAL